MITRMARNRVALVALAAVLLGACGTDGETTDTAASATSSDPTGTATPGSALPPAELTVEVLNEYPHDPEAFTQGLLLDDGVLYESTGNYGYSTLRAVVPDTGEVLEQHDLAPEYFAEGLALVDDRLIQLTWREQTAFEYELEGLEPTGELGYDTEGWGLCYDGERLVMSDGTSTLYFRDAETFEELGTVEVTMQGEPVDRINELECVDDDVWANVWQTDSIIRIDASTGEVGAIVDATGLLSEEQHASADVLNGIAYDAGDETFLITGKWWPTLFEVRFVPE